jgi:PPOX class probable F420-dependent enzyme
MPDYGLVAAESGEGLLPWSWAIQRLEKARNYWIATRRADGQPHLMPVWGVWLDETFYFSTGRHSRKARNLTDDPRCVVSPEQADEAVIVEGVAEVVSNPSQLARVADAYSTKYAWIMEPTLDGVRDVHGNEGPLFAVHPRVVFGFGGDLASSATRWVFAES